MQQHQLTRGMDDDDDDNNNNIIIIIIIIIYLLLFQRSTRVDIELVNRLQ